MDRVTNIAWKTTGGTSLGGFAYEYDAIGRITARSLEVGTNSFDRAYAYDDLDRLVSDGGVAYTYDAAGNRMTRTEDGETVTYALGVGVVLAAHLKRLGVESDVLHGEVANDVVLRLVAEESNHRLGVVRRNIASVQHLVHHVVHVGGVLRHIDG